MFTAHITKKLRDFSLQVSLEVEAGETLVIVGPSGCGKTTSLNAIAGLVTPDVGHIALDEQVLFDSDSRTDMPVELRRIGYVFQDFALFPHLTVHENVAYGLRCRGLNGQDVRRRVQDALELLRIAHLAQAKPPRLSGGEQQRVALARAIAPDSALMLLDEPLGSLDAQARRRVRGELRTVLRSFGRPSVMVTHDHIDALTLGDRICVLDRGQVLQMGPKDSLLRRPRSRFVAELIGVNFFEGTISSVRHNGLAQVKVGEAVLYAGTQEVGDTLLTFFPSDVTLSRERPHGSALNVFQARVQEVVHLGDRVRISLDGDLPIVAEITAQSLSQLDIQEGGSAFASIKATAIKTYR